MIHTKEELEGTKTQGLICCAIIEIKKKQNHSLGQLAKVRDITQTLRLILPVFQWTGACFSWNDNLSFCRPQ